MRGLAWSIVVVVSFAALGSAQEFERPAAATTAACTISGTGGADQLVGTSAAEVLCGDGGDHLIHQAAGVKTQMNSLFGNETNLCNVSRGGGHTNP
jgi:hypothetical protein